MTNLDLDPFPGPDPFAGVGALPGLPSGRRPRTQRAEFRRPLPPEQSAHFGRQVLDSGASGLSYVLGTLDKPGQAVRGLLGGHGLSALKHLVPFSDSTGLTTEADHVSGRDLTDKFGLTDRRDKGWGAWGVGLAADVATDPLSYTTFGVKHALTGVGKAVQKTGALKGWTGRALLEGFHGVEPAMLKAGQTASDVGHAIDQGRRIAQGAAAATGVQAHQPLSSLVRIGLPLGGPAVNLGTGRTAQKVAGALDTAGDWLRYKLPGAKAVASLLDHSAHGAVDEITQRGARQYLDPALDRLQRQARDDRFGVIRELDPLVSAGTFPEATVNDAARAVAEGVPHSFDPGLAAQVQGVANHVGSVNSRYLAEARAAGAPIKDVGDKYAAYVHRSAFPENPNGLGLGGKRGQGMFPTTSAANIGRDDVFRDIPGGTARINDWFDRFAGLTKQRPAVARAVKKDLVQDFQRGGGTMTPALGKEFDAKAAAMAERLEHASEVYRSTADEPGRPFFSPDLTADMTQRGRQHARTVASAKAAIGVLGDVARRYRNDGSMVPLSHAMKKLGLRTYKADAKAGTPMEGALVQMYRGLARQGAGKVDPYLMGKMKALRGAVDQFGISKEHLDQLTKASAKWQAPEQIKSTLAGVDSVTNAFKALAYPIWLPSHVRNAFTAATNNLRHGVGLGDYLDQLKVMTGRGSRDLSGVHPSLTGLAPAQQVDELRRLQYGSANIFGGHGMNDEIAGNVKAAYDQNKRFTPHVPGSDRAGVHGNLAADTADLVLRQGLASSVGATGRAVGGAVANLLNPGRRWGQSFAENLGIKGVGGAAQDVLPAVKAGRIAGSNIEDFFRGALWNKLAREGADPGVAAEAINQLHFDYDRLTGFEKNVMRRVMPFYTFARNNLPLQVETALHTPGVINAQYKPFRQEQPGEPGYVPKYLASGLAIPTGPEQDGQRQYLSKLGLPAEEAFEKLHFQDGLPDWRATALDFMGGMNPLIKAPLEQLFDTQFHTQRRLSDLKAPAAANALGRLFGDDNPQLLSQVLANSPLTRFVTSADKLLDPRKSWGQKALNLLTGARVTDVDTDKQRAIDLRTALEEMMRGHPHLSRYQSFYVRPEDVASLTPEEIEMMRMYSGLQDQARKYTEAKRRKIEVRP